MFNGVLYVRDLCDKKGIAISQLEKDCGFSNGYLNPKKLKRIPYERAVLIADYLQISVDEIYHGPENEKTPADDGKRSAVNEDEIVKFALFKGDGEVTDAMLDEVKAFAAFVQQREKQKKETK